jgi:SAM-dependent MidA family methyltransferase
LADGPVEIIEAGAHDGRLAEDILGAIDRLGGADAARFGYRIIEPSPVRQSWQAGRLACFGDRVRWSPSMPGRDTGVPGLRGVILSNELLDAFPVERWRWSADLGRWVEQGVAWRQDRFEWVPLPTLPPPGWELPPELEAVLPEGFVRERSPAAVDWWTHAARSLEAGCLLAVDYGLDAEEFLVPHRADGTLRAYHRHRVGGDLLASPGEVDLTAHVDFSAIAAAGEREGLTTWCRQAQSRFLLGILESTRRWPSGFPEWTQARVRAFQTLTHPEHFGRSFRVLAQGRGPAPAGVR